MIEEYEIRKYFFAINSFHFLHRKIVKNRRNNVEKDHFNIYIGYTKFEFDRFPINSTDDTFE